jgi:hypothetical protein
MQIIQKLPEVLVARMWEQMIRIEILVICRPHSSSMRTLVAKTSPHMYTNENLKW